MDFNEFATKIKEKYPEYADKDNRVLAEAMIKKHPEYGDRVTFEPSTPEAPKFYELEKQQGLPKTIGEKLLQPIKQAGEALVSPMPGSFAKFPIEAASQTASQLGADVAKGLSTPGGALPDVGKPLARLGGLAASVAADPLSYAPVGALAKQAKKLTPVEQATKTAQTSLRSVLDKVESKLAAAKKTLGIPVGPKEQAEALEKTGNVVNFSKKDIGEIATSLAQGNKNISGLIEDALITAKGDIKNFPKMTVNKPQTPEQVSRRFLAPPSEGIKAGGMGGDELAPLAGREAPKVVDKQLIEEVRSFVHPDTIKKPDELVIAINRFKRHADDLPDSARIKIATTLQNKINSFVDWTKQQGASEGILKQQYKELAEAQFPAALKASKEEMSKVLSTAKELKPLLGKPGQAEQFLRRVLTGKSAMNKDKIEALATLEKLTGEPIISTLEQAIKKEGPSLFTEMAKDVPVAGPLFKRTIDLIKTALESPTVEKLVKGSIKQGVKLGGIGFGKPLQEAYPEAGAVLQSIRDKMRHAK